MLKTDITQKFIAKHHQIDRDKNTSLLTLVSQTRENINIEIIQDDSYKTFNEIEEISSMKTLQSTSKLSMKSKLVQSKSVDDEGDKQFQAKVVYFVSVYQRNDILVDSKIGWCTNEQLILSINNQYYLLDLNKRQMLLQNTNNNILYGKQHNSGFFITIASSMDKKKEELSQSAYLDSFQPDLPVNTVDARIKMNLLIVKAQECLQKMDIANLSRYVFIKNAKNHID